MKIVKLLLCLFFIGVAGLCAGPSFAYILQAEKFAKNKADFIKKINESGRDFVIIDYSFDGTEKGIWQSNELAAMKKGDKKRKILAYLSIGEAENYRTYWKADWLKGKRPEFLLDENPEWKGNYRVRYWNKRWQEIVIKYLDTIIQQGFDGVYLDIVDGYEFFEKGKDMRINRETQRSYREDMKRFVANIARHAKRTSPRFLIFQQNALALLVDYAYLRLLDGVGAEDVFTDGTKFNSDRDMRESLRYLKKAQATGLKIMIVDYAKQAILQELIIKNASANRLDFLMTDRELTKLGTFVMINESSQDAKSGGKRQSISFSTP